MNREDWVTCGFDQRHERSPKIFKRKGVTNFGLDLFRSTITYGIMNLQVHKGFLVVIICKKNCLEIPLRAPLWREQH